MIDMIDYIHARLDRLALFPLGFVAVLSLSVIATAAFEDSSASAVQTAEEDSLTTIAAAVP